MRQIIPSICLSVSVFVSILNFFLVSIFILSVCLFASFPIFSVCLLLLYIFFLSPSLSSLSFSLHLYPYFPYVSSSILIFRLSPTLSLFSVCLHLNLYFLYVSILILIFCLSPYRDGDCQKIKIDGDRPKMRIELETNKKCGKSGDRQKIRKRWIQTNNGG